MRAIVTDAIALAAVRPLDLLAYLRAQGWSPLASPADAPLLDWWKEGDRGYVEVQVPRHPSWRDYARRIHDALSALAIEEARSQLDILRDITNVSRDVIRFRSVLEGRADGTLPLEDATRVTSAARGVMLAAACAAVDPRRSYPSRKPPAATAFLGQLSVGQTEHGSFVITLFCPLMPALHGHASIARDGGAGAEPLNRRVTRTLGTALTAVTEAALAGVTTGDLTAFDDAVAAGVSADLCEALGQVKDCTAVTQLDIRLGWAAARPPSSPPRAVHELTRDALEVIGEAGRRLRERARSPTGRSRYPQAHEQLRLGFEMAADGSGARFVGFLAPFLRRKR